jgi:hypothetical protein
MHWFPAAQQSDAVVHFSNSFEHPVGWVTHTGLLPCSALQNPLQHWSPDSQPTPSWAHAGSTQ